MGWLTANPGKPQTMVEIASLIVGGELSDNGACEQLRAEGRLGRNGANTPASPCRFYVKRTPPGVVS